MTWWSVVRSCFCDRFNFQTAKSQKVFETVIASEAKQSMAAAKMDCFAEPVIGRAFARPVGSQ
jgi:hypothetical protein